MKARSVEYRWDTEAGREVAIVPLSRDGSKGECIVHRDDYEMLVAGGLSPNWSVSGRHNVMARLTKDCGSGGSEGRSVSIARLIMGCAAGQTIRYRNGDGRDCRRSNLRVVNGGFSIRSEQLASQ